MVAPFTTKTNGGNVSNTEQAAKTEMVTILMDDEPCEISRWTFTQLEALAYREGKTVEEVILEALHQALADFDKNLEAFESA